MNYAGPKRRGGHPLKYPLTKRARALVAEKYRPLRRDSGRAEIAAELGVPKWVITRWAREMGLARVKEPFWTDDELAYLEANLGRVSWRRMAKRLGRTMASVQIKAKRSGLNVAAVDASTARDLAVLLDVDSHRVIWWIQRGWLAATRDCKGGAYRFTERALREFLRDHGHALDLSRVNAAWLMRIAFGESRSSPSDPRLR